jgi:hypothetical protein
MVRATTCRAACKISALSSPETDVLGPDQNAVGPGRQIHHLLQTVDGGGKPGQSDAPFGPVFR